jgi:hypothetical protein
MLKRAVLMWAVFMGIGTADAASSGGPLGVGLGGVMMVSGISGKYFMGDSALQGVVGRTHVSDGNLGLGLGADYLLEQPIFYSDSGVDFSWNYGAGTSIGIGAVSALNVSGVVGLEVGFSNAPLDIVIEYRPGVLLVPDLSVDLINFSGHIRYYF